MIAVALVIFIVDEQGFNAPTIMSRGETNRRFLCLATFNAQGSAIIQQGCQRITSRKSVWSFNELIPQLAGLKLLVAKFDAVHVSRYKVYG